MVLIIGTESNQSSGDRNTEAVNNCYNHHPRFVCGLAVPDHRWCGYSGYIKHDVINDTKHATSTVHSDMMIVRPGLNHLQFLPRYQLLDGQYESLEIRVTVPNKTGPTLRSLGTAYNGQQQNIFRNIFKIEILLV